MTKDDRRRAKVRRACRPVLEKLGIWQTYEVNIALVNKIDGTVRGAAAATITNRFPYRVLDVEIVRSCVDSYNARNLRSLVLHEALHEVVYGWVRYYFKVTLPEAVAEEAGVSLLETWLMDNVNV